MRNSVRKFAIVLVWLLLIGSLRGQGASIGDANDTSPEQPNVKAAVIVCKGMIDDGLFESIKRRTQIALDGGAEYLIYEINTLGGLVSSAYDISEYFLHEANREAKTVAYISKKAVSAGALISVGCEDIIMKETTRIGACAPMALGMKLDDVEREKIESDIRTVFVNSAQANGYPEALLRAMVTREIEVFRIKNLETGEDEFFESTDMPKDPNAYDLANKKVIVTKEQILDITAAEALEYGIARAVVKNVAGALDFLAKRDGVSFASEPMVLKPLWSEEMVRWLNSPAVMAVLVMIALLGIYIEFNTPGVGLPGLVAVICFVIIIGSKHLHGLANWVEVLLFAIGLLLLLIEIFVLPGFGIAGFLGITFILVGLFGMLVKNGPDELPWPRDALAWKDFTDGVIGLSAGFFGFVILAWLLAKYLPRLQFLSGLMLAPTAAKLGTEVEVSMTTLPESKRIGVSIGELGEVVSKLRPTGKARFGNAIVDVVAEGEFLDMGAQVEIISIRGNRVVVRKIED
jgi:membrane-bound serine protease (ClpP class)